MKAIILKNTRLATTSHRHLGRMSLGCHGAFYQAGGSRGLMNRTANGTSSLGPSNSIPLLGQGIRWQNFSTASTAPETSKSSSPVQEADSETKEATEGSIFDEADYTDSSFESDFTTFSPNPNYIFLDTNDQAASFQAVIPKVSENIPIGQSTYGFWEYISYMDGIIFDTWMILSQTTGLGMCGGLILTAALTKFAFLPIGIYSQLTSHKLKLLQPDMDEIQSKIKRYQ